MLCSDTIFWPLRLSRTIILLRISNQPTINPAFLPAIILINICHNCLLPFWYCISKEAFSKQFYWNFKKDDFHNVLSPLHSLLNKIIYVSLGAAPYNILPILVALNMFLVMLLRTFYYFIISWVFHGFIYRFSWFLTNSIFRFSYYVLFFCRKYISTSPLVFVSSHFL